MSVGNALLEMNGRLLLLLLKKVPPNLLLLTDYPKGENGLWDPLDLLKCTSSAKKDAIPDDWGPNFQQSFKLLASGP